MKLMVRTLAICAVIAGGAAVSLSTPTPHALPSHQSATAGLPVPLCGPWVPCPPEPTGHLR